MQPLNPYLAAFFKSSIPSQCEPATHHVLLVPTTDALLTSRDAENGALLSEAVASDDFLSSHVLRIPPKSAAAGGKDVAPNLREMKGKAKPYNTINGRSVVIKDGIVYSNKGFKSLAHANLLSDAIWYSDTLEPRQWLVYYITRPLIGSWEEIKITKATIPETRPMPAPVPAKSNPLPVDDEARNLPRKKDIKSFHELLNHFPVIARQMQPGLEKIFREFTLAFERPLPPPPSSVHIPDPAPEGPITTAMKRARSNSMSAGKTSLQRNQSSHVTEAFYAEDDEDVMRASLETAITTAIDLFQAVDKQQLSLLGATTDLTGPLVERLIERYVAENLHHLIYPRLSAIKRLEDLELEAKIRQMEFIDVSQLGITLEGGVKAKHDLTTTLGRAIQEFQKMSAALSPQEMLEALLSTLKAVTQLTSSENGAAETTTEKPLLMVNADTLVSLLLLVVIRAQVRYLQARFVYIRHFIFIDDVDSGEIGYAMSTFEAVLSYLTQDSAVLRRASRRNKTLWDAAAQGELSPLKQIMEPSHDDIGNDSVGSPAGSSRTSRRHSFSSTWSFSNSSFGRSSTNLSVTDRFSLGSNLDHVFPFQSQDGASDEIAVSFIKKVKKVSMDTRSMSSGSEASFHSGAFSFATLGSGVDGDIAVETLAHTRNRLGESVLMMAIQNERPQALRYLLGLSEYYPPAVVLEDINHEDTTLLSAAVQLGHTELITTILDFLRDAPEVDLTRMRSYFAQQDIWGRSVAHYLFQAPFLISNYGRMMPWTQKDKNGQTPLFALCRSYDHSSYHNMVSEGLDVASATQGDGQILHLEDHVDGKGNTLLHIINDPQIAMRILQTCNVDVNAINDKKFTPLMVASKYGRFDMVRALFSDPRVDAAAREVRGLTAVELAKDDDVRNRIDDLVLFALPSTGGSRTTGVVRSYFVEDASVRFVLKSGAPVDNVSYAVTTCRRSLSDFEQLAKLLAMENPASWIPSLKGLRSPCQIPAKPSRSTLKDLQDRMDWFIRIMLAHPTFATHEMLWEFFLVPDLQFDMMEQRSKLKAETRTEKVRDEYEPLKDLREVEQFVNHAREMVRSINYATRSVMRRTNLASIASTDLYDAALILNRVVSSVSYLPETHVSAFETYARTLAPTQSTPLSTFHTSFVAVVTTIDALLAALARPPQIISQIHASRRQSERNYNSINRSTRWPLGLLDDARQRLNEEREDRAKQSQIESENLAKELRYTQQTVAAELAGWQDMHEKIGRLAIRDFARNMVVHERMQLDGMRRALRKISSSSSSNSSSSGSHSIAGEVLETEDDDASKKGDASRSSVAAAADGELAKTQTLSHILNDTERS